MAGVFVPVSSNVTLSPDEKATRFVPLNQLVPLPTAQRLVVPSPTQIKLDGWVCAWLSGTTSNRHRVGIGAAIGSNDAELKTAQPEKIQGRA